MNFRTEYKNMTGGEKYMVRRYIKADITTPLGAPRINYPEGWYDNVEKILVRVYDDVNRLCYAELEDEELFQKLMATGRVTEITAEEIEAEVVRLRPPPPDVDVVLTGKGKDHKVDIEDLLKSKGVKYRIEER